MCQCQVCLKQVAPWLPVNCRSGPCHQHCMGPSKEFCLHSVFATCHAKASLLSNPVSLQEGTSPAALPWRLTPGQTKWLLHIAKQHILQLQQCLTKMAPWHAAGPSRCSWSHDHQQPGLHAHLVMGQGIWVVLAALPTGQSK